MDRARPRRRFPRNRKSAGRYRGHALHHANPDTSMASGAGAASGCEADLLRDYPTLTVQDLANAWNFVRSHRAEIDAQIEANDRDND
jgi:hypothetical protein